MTAYAMSAHLALNTIWLWLYLRPERREFYLAPIVGALAIGLHQPIVHALFVLPFLARLVWEKRWRPVLIFGAIYLGACVFWYAWKRHFASPTGGSNGISSIFRLVNPSMAIIQPMNLLLIIAWASLATPLLAVLGFKRAFKAPSVLQDAALSCILTFVFVGRGTPAPFDPPRQLVARGPYAFVRNPMYLGAAAALLGAALYYRSPALAAYAIAFLIATHLFVRLYEEPTLRRTFGDEYESYCRRVGRWWPRRTTPAA